MWREGGSNGSGSDPVDVSGDNLYASLDSLAVQPTRRPLRERSNLPEVRSKSVLRGWKDRSKERRKERSKERTVVLSECNPIFPSDQVQENAGSDYRSKLSQPGSGDRMNTAERSKPVPAAGDGETRRRGAVGRGRSVSLSRLDQQTGGIHGNRRVKIRWFSWLPFLKNRFLKFRWLIIVAAAM